MQQRTNRRGAKAPKKKNKNNGLKQAPVAMNRSSRQTPTKKTSYNERERITTIVGSVNFSVGQTVRINPGLSESFPWLSGHAQLYEKYHFRKLLFRYKNLKGTSSNGNVIMSFDYDALDGAPATAVEQTQSTYYIDGSVWRIFELSVPVSHLPPLYTRASLIGSSDLKTYDIGQLFVATEGCADTSDHGYLEVEYHCDLIDKQVGGGAAAAVSSILVANLSTNTVISSTTDPIPFDEIIVNGLSASNASGVFTVPAGKYLVVGEFSHTVASSTMEILVDSAAISPPVKAVTGSAAVGGGSLSGYLSLATQGTIQLSATTTGATSFTADCCRLIIQLL